MSKLKDLFKDICMVFAIFFLPINLLSIYGMEAMRFLYEQLNWDLYKGTNLEIYETLIIFNSFVSGFVPFFFPFMALGLYYLGKRSC